VSSHLIHWPKPGTSIFSSGYKIIDIALCKFSDMNKYDSCQKAKDEWKGTTKKKCIFNTKYMLIYWFVGKKSR
jgi:hypothetical protein